MASRRQPAPLLVAIGFAAALAAPRLASAQDDGPTLDLAPEHSEAPDKQSPGVALGSGPVLDDGIERDLADQRFRHAQSATTNTAIGGYGEIVASGTTRGKEGERKWVADVARLVVFVAHAFNDSVRAYTEIEVEHAAACGSCGGAVEIEQAYVDWKLFDEKLALRGGLVLVPMGILNHWHEPPIYHGAVRPRVETVVIPTTWREIAIGVFGRPTDFLRYELYAMTGLDPLGMGASGLGGARQNGSFARANGWAAVGRVEVEPILGLSVGASGYAGDAGPNGDFYDRRGNEADLRLPVLAFEVDARFHGAGIEWKILFAEWDLPESAALMAARGADGAPLFADPSRPVATRIRGGYVEGAYDVLRPFGVSHKLLPFARLEAYDTQAAVPAGYVANPTLSVRETTFGLTYRPISAVVLKADYQLRNRKLGIDETQLNFGAGFMY